MLPAVVREGQGCYMPRNEQGRCIQERLYHIPHNFQNVLMDIHAVKTCVKLPDPRTLNISVQSSFCGVGARF